MHSKGKGIADSALPFKRTHASWVKLTSKDVEEEGASAGCRVVLERGVAECGGGEAGIGGPWSLHVSARGGRVIE